MQLYMNKLSSLLERNNIKLTVAVYPWPDQVYHNDLNSRHVQVWRNWSQEHEVTFINYFPYFIDSVIFLENYDINNNTGNSREQHQSSFHDVIPQ